MKQCAVQPCKFHFAKLMKHKLPLAVSIDEDLANWISQQTEILHFRNKSHLVEEAIKEFLKK